MNKSTTCLHHHGHSVRRIRLASELTQRELGKRIGMSIQNIYRCESKEELSDDILAQFAKGLNVPVEFIKNLEEEEPMFYFENNTFSPTETSIVNFGGYINQIDKSLVGTLNTINDMCQSVQKQHEAVITTLRETVELYKRENRELKQQISDLKGDK